MRAIFLCLIFMAGIVSAEQQYGERQASQYPNDTAPSRVWFVGPIIVEPVRIPSDFGGGLYFPKPYYYWRLGLKDAGLQVGADGTKMFSKQVHGYNGNPGIIKLTFPGAPEDLRVRLVGFPDLEETVIINGVEVPFDDFVREATACEYYWNPSLQNKNPCTIYQTIVPSDGKLIQLVESDGASVLKITSAPQSTVPPPPAPPPPPPVDECAP